jgi:uncharacterized membrane protein
MRHRGAANPLLLVLAVLLLLAVGFALAPKAAGDKGAGAATLQQVKAVIDARCVACHAAAPTYAGFAQPPKGVMLEFDEQILMHAPKIAETVASRYMPIGNLTQITDAEREIIAAWFRGGAKAK